MKLNLLALPTPPAIVGYGVAVLSVAAALGLIWWMQTVQLPEAHVSLFLCAVMFSAWFGGARPGLVAIALSALALAYYFLEPVHSFAVESAELPRLFLYVLSALFVGTLSAAQRSTAQSLRRARDDQQQVLQELTRTNERLQAENRERQRAEGKLREQAGLLDLTHDTVFVRNMNDVITYWNRGAEERYGWKSEEAIGQVSHQLLQTIFPEPQVFPDPLEEIMATLFHTGRWEGELVHTKRDGTRVTVASRWALQRDAAGRPVEILETNNDITERKRAERALEQALRESEERRRAAEALAQVGRVLTERLDVTVVVRRIAESLRELFAADVVSVFRQGPSGELIALQGDGRDAGRGAALGHAARARGSRARAFASGGPSSRRTSLRILASRTRPNSAPTSRPAGPGEPCWRFRSSPRTGSWASSPCGGRSPSTSGRSSLAQAFADQAVIALENARLYQQVSAAYEDLARTQEELRRVGRATTLGALAASIAHEVNQPLGAVVTSAASCSRWLSAEPPDLDKARRALDRIVRDGQRASEVIVRIRALVTRRAPRKDPVDINESIRDVLPLARGEIERSGVVLRTRFAEDLPLVPGDRVQLQQVILNLIVNGIEAMSGRRRSAAGAGARLRGARGGWGPGRGARLGQWAGPRARRSALRGVLFHQARRHGHGAHDQPLDRRGPRRPAVGDAERASRRGLPVLAARRRGGALAAGMLAQRRVPARRPTRELSHT